MRNRDDIPTAADCLYADERIASILRRAGQYAEIERDCIRILPSWFAGCRVLKLENGTLSVSAPNQASAARLRQKVPELKQSLSQKGWAVDAVRVRILFPETTGAPKEKAPMPEAAYKAFHELRRKLEEEGGSPLLLQAVSSLLKNRP